MLGTVKTFTFLFFYQIHEFLYVIRMIISFRQFDFNCFFSDDNSNENNLRTGDEATEGKVY